ncbi:hypothetical protein HOD83_01565 [Candidatus Woesearchaeota archaeon]|jgi:hypothetical protein|nr:hypothetical protein [Candidatus Woesearchaeota archaeon]MBT4114191.1 hypothetical protein [Candidatus Woesearchaeota archaeon]MBT4248259.1 hypothetical protein [Candidatus Woesearchaeota archaeon]
MALKKYIEDIGGLKVFYKISKGRITGGFSLTQIESGDKYDIAEELDTAIFGRGVKDVHVFTTDKFWYVHGADDYLTVDIAVVSLDKKRGEREFKKQLRASKKIKRDSLIYLNKTLKPFLSRLIKTELVEAILGRGDLFNPKRTPNAYSDIDITLLVNFKNTDKRDKSKLYMFLKKSPGKVYVDYYFLSTNRYYNKEKLLVDRKARHAPSYDIIPLGDFKEFKDFYKSKKRKVCSKYEYETFSTAKILFQKNKAGDKFIRELLSISRKP